MSDSAGRRLRELVGVFGTLGVIGFGGPAAHIGLMHRETVERRHWLSDQAFADLIGVTSLIPGPNSTELALLVGRRRAGGMGMLVAGAAFILPAATIVLALAWGYVAFGDLPTGRSLLYGVKPVMVAIVVVALVTLGRAVLRSIRQVAIAVACALLWAIGINELILLATGALVMALARRTLSRPPTAVALAVPAAAATTAAGVDLVTLGGVFLKAGALLFGSGYVLLAFLRGDLVDRLGWLTDAQLLDAVTVGQITPGPLFTTATFVGYLVAGVPGAIVSTVAIFLPAFVLCALIGRYADRIRDRPVTAAMLDGLNAAALGLMAAVTLILGQSAFVDPLTIAIGGIALVALLAFRLPSVLAVAAGAAVGLAAGALGWVAT